MEEKDEKEMRKTSKGVEEKGKEFDRIRLWTNQKINRIFVFDQFNSNHCVML